MWDCFVKQSRNATFLFYRDYMEYHQSRFEDGSLLFLNERGTCCGLLPCNLLPHEATIVSHGGLTYGGLLLAKKATAEEVRDMLKSTADYYIEKGYKQLISLFHTSITVIRRKKSCIGCFAQKGN